MDRGLNSSKVQASNIAVRGSSSDGSERKKESYRENFHLLREHRNHHELDIPRNVYVNDFSDENSPGNEKHVIGN